METVLQDSFPLFVSDALYDPSQKNGTKHLNADILSLQRRTQRVMHKNLFTVRMFIVGVLLQKDFICCVERIHCLAQGQFDSAVTSLVWDCHSMRGAKPLSLIS